MSMLNGLDARLIAGIDTMPTPGEQLHSDLHYLNEVGVLGDGSDPLRIWLHNAATLSHLRPEAAVFANYYHKLFGVLVDCADWPLSTESKAHTPVPSIDEARRRIRRVRLRLLAFFLGTPGLLYASAHLSYIAFVCTATICLAVALAELHYGAHFLYRSRTRGGPTIEVHFLWRFFSKSTAIVLVGDDVRLFGTIDSEPTHEWTIRDARFPNGLHVSIELGVRPHCAIHHGADALEVRRKWIL